MSAGFPNSSTVLRGICKQVLSGDAIIIRTTPQNGPPKERQLNLSNVTAPRLARRATNATASSAEVSVDEPCAWQSREFLRKKLVGREVIFTIDMRTNTGREYGYVYLGADIESGENIVETLVSEGLVQVRRDSGRDTTRLGDLETTAKSQGKGKWAPDASKQVRNIIWSVENPRVLVEKFAGSPVPAVIEHVRDGSTLRAFLLPDMYYVTVMLSGVRAPITRIGDDNRPDPSKVEPYFDVARFFVESRLLQRDVHIVLESVNNANYVGSVLHPNGNIAELLLREGLARCVDWSIAHARCGVDVLRAAERSAKEKRLRIWKDYSPANVNLSDKDKEFSAKVVEVVNGDALVVKMADNSTKKIFLSSVRPPRVDKDSGIEGGGRAGKTFRPLYDVPFLFEAREYLRRKAIGQKVHVHVDYVQPAGDLPERCCCTVKMAGVNLAEALVGRGLATVVRYRQDEERRSSHYDALLAAEMKAQKSGNGMFGKTARENATVKVQDCCGDVVRAKQFFPFLQRMGRVDGVVEFVASGSRMRVFVARETCLFTFLLAGVSCPRGSRPAPGGGGQLPAEPYGDQAAEFTRDLCLQREVQLEVDSMDKGGNFIGWLTVDGKNLSVELVSAGLAKMHFSAENSPHATAIQRAEERACAARKNIWKNYVEKPVGTANDPAVTNKSDELAGSAERKENYRTVVVTEVSADGHFFAQFADKGPELETMMEKMRAELSANPPVAGAYRPKRGDLCAAKFAEDGEWYRARVERVTGPSEVSVLYIDYGNRATVTSSSCAPLPAGFAAAPRHAREYALALCRLPPDSDMAAECGEALREDICGRQVQLNVEYRETGGVGGGGASSGLEYVTLRTCGNDSYDVAKQLVTDGLMLVQRRSERRLQQLLSEYQQAQDEAKHQHRNIWRYGDITEDEATEFGRL